MIENDLREELKTLDDAGLKCIIGYCIGLIDGRGKEEEEETESETVCTLTPCHNSEFKGIECLESENQYGFFKSEADVRPGHATWIDKEIAEKVYRVFETIFKNQKVMNHEV